ncbi:MAG: metal dependent phosphohydrolase [Verrucomicrobiales bacterium]|nr:metal dependent phosphohydrolase [Verrucomicrobiales bacterium]
MMADLEHALQLAVRAHAGQKDKNGAAYIFHPIRVMSRCVTPDAKIAALLHDVVEDTDMTFEQLEQAGFSAEVMATVRLLTHESSVSYDDYVTAIITNPTAVEVKLADLEDNSSIQRLQSMDGKTVARMEKYIRAWNRLAAVRNAQSS